MAKAKPAKKTAAASGQIRLIGGQWRGRKLPVLHSEGLRPTTDRVKETLFNWLMFDIRDRRCLDLFAGSGSLGFEALSRYAAEVVMVEKDAAVAGQLKRNLATLPAAPGAVVQADAVQFLQQPATPFDVVFLDPPFHQELLPKVCERLENHGWLADDALVYIEREQGLALPTLPTNWSLLKDKQAGQVSYQLYQREQVK
ncbi:MULTISPECIES: 16S rRNA (guanine(966)-N(2))-methyltransferase RsmD [Oceanimonas]|uniref:Ribosomal RNA small subunit methyltransferase D n=1 Tax=Oceanimonas doudoroffii TaxID=84158 RepID=A0A233RDC3_9GAMM|nr:MULTISPECIES: 16S rRNA (guanine(966)-N(2))-methyltransferase RsmD [Oceanimonas]NHH99373.1 Ribosomal RNA small subunit methyltransferase D [Oceanimonas sp. MB9]OXY81385.1 16S rRNA (guanine(966)-N(2))-methyltransferase RsmD [Oceanimonas doudoroffii]